MKKIYIISVMLATLACLFAGCRKQDDVYKEYVVKGGYNYPAKPKGLVSAPGHGRVVLTWDLPTDPAVKSAKVYWDSRTKEKDIDYSLAVAGTVSAEITELEDRSYSFEVVNFDAKGNKSLAAEIIVSPYGDGWLSTHAERDVKAAKIVDGYGMFVMGKPRDEMYSTKFRFRNTSGEWVESQELFADKDTLFVPNVLKGKKFQYKSSYKPANGLDAVWSNNWISPDMVLVYKIDGISWDVTCTSGQTRDASYGPKKAFDGIADISHSYYSSTKTTNRLVFPKIISVDTKTAAGEEYTITEFNMIQAETEAYRYSKGVDIYVGDTSYDPDAGKAYLDTYGEAAVKKTFYQTTQEESAVLPVPVSGRYFAFVFKNSYSTNGYINVWEIEPWGYLESELD